MIATEAITEASSPRESSWPNEGLDADPEEIELTKAAADPHGLVRLQHNTEITNCR